MFQPKRLKTWVILASFEERLGDATALQIPLAQKSRRFECYRAPELDPGDLAMTFETMGMTSETMGMTSRNYDHDRPELWDGHRGIMTMTARNYEIDILKL